MLLEATTVVGNRDITMRMFASVSKPRLMPSRKRNRTLSVATTAAAALSILTATRVVQGFSSPIYSHSNRASVPVESIGQRATSGALHSPTPSALFATTTTLTHTAGMTLSELERLTQRSEQDIVKRTSYFDDFYYDDIEEDDYEDEDDFYDLPARSSIIGRSSKSDVRGASVSDDSIIQSVHSISASTGSEVMQSDLQYLQEEPSRFLQNAFDAEDTSFTEQLALQSVSAQWPRSTLQAMEQQQKQRAQKGDICKEDEASPSLSRQEKELELARQIQAGVALHKLRRSLTFEGGDDQKNVNTHPTRNDWAQAAGLSPRELRRQVVAYRRAKHDLVSANLGLVHSVVDKEYWYNSARQVHYKRAGVTREELVQEGALGLLRAAELFDPARGLRFSTYAVVWIKGMLSNSHLHEHVRLPSRERSKWNKIRQAQRDLQRTSMGVVDGGMEGMAVISPEQIAASTGISVADVIETQQRMNQAQNVLSLDYQYSTQSRSGTMSSSGGMENAVEGQMAHNNRSNSKPSSKNGSTLEDTNLLERASLQADVIAAMAKNLDDREARLMRLRYGLVDGRSRTLKECAEAMGLSFTRVQQLSKKCLEKLRQAEDAGSLEEYLLTIA